MRLTMTTPPDEEVDVDVEVEVDVEDEVDVEEDVEVDEDVEVEVLVDVEVLVLVVAAKASPYTTTVQAAHPSEPEIVKLLGLKVSWSSWSDAMPESVPPGPDAAGSLIWLSGQLLGYPVTSRLSDPQQAMNMFS